MFIKIPQLLYSILNLILINIYFGLLKLLKKKIIFFYHPKENLTSIHDFYLSKLVKKNSLYKVAFGSKCINTKHFYLKGVLLKFVLFVDIFVSNNISDAFTNKSKKVYIHHDIYDTPLVDRKDQFILKKRLLKYDVILIPSKKSSYIFDKIFKGEQRKPTIMILGFYPKLNYLLSKIKKSKSSAQKIIVAPTQNDNFKDLNLNKYLELIISKLIKSDFTVIYRPHPSDIEDGIVSKILKTYKKCDRFLLDTSSNYLKSYESTKFMITDVSGTAYTYALLTKNPVFFYSKNENIITKSDY
ncbi:CDP-glycerol glycerophosphotransferase family protein, partial [Candidatus Pelagibacter sp.]|nr:CDP-glycerol glycerophosphotransferase family protein [Candidatus Pelagibacter sp.]